MDDKDDATDVCLTFHKMRLYSYRTVRKTFFLNTGIRNLLHATQSGLSQLQSFSICCNLIEKIYTHINYHKQKRISTVFFICVIGEIRGEKVNIGMGKSQRHAYAFALSHPFGVLASGGRSEFRCVDVTQYVHFRFQL